MLNYLHIRNLAVVAELELELRPGMTALTGETGAGKSILIDALGLALGERGDASLIRAGNDRAEVSAVFDVSATADAREWLTSKGYDSDEELILRRVLVRGGRGRAFVNGDPVSLQTLQEVGELLIDIHGQHAHQSLLRRNSQRRLLDGYGRLLERVAAVDATYRAWRDVQRQLEELRSQIRDRGARLDLLSFQVEELRTLDLSQQELQTLEEEQSRLGHAEQLRALTADLVERLYQSEHALHSQLARASSDLSSAARFDPALGDPAGLLDEAAISIEEAAFTLRDYVQRLNSDPGALERIEQRLADIYAIARKYRMRPDEIPALLERLESELSGLERADIEIEALEQQETKLRADYFELAAELGKLRTDAALMLSKAVTEHMQGLGMTGGHFAAELVARDATTPSAGGMEDVEFLVSANPGMPAQALAKIASGGELSRISLAIQVVTAKCGQVPTLIFDEVDVGIGGGVAEIVGRLLHTVGQARQVLCVTHLPQVAAVSDHHLKIVKATDGKSTRTTVETLANEARVAEVARMLGGVKITEQTRAHALEMIELGMQSAG